MAAVTQWWARCVVLAALALALGRSTDARRRARTAARSRSAKKATTAGTTRRGMFPFRPRISAMD